MRTYDELDPDVVRWGLHHIDVCSITSNGSPESVTFYQNDYTRTESVREGYCEPIHPVVENDEVIAHALQEELSRLTVTEVDSSGYQKDSVLAQDWLGPSRRHSDYDTEQSGWFQSNEDGASMRENLEDQDCLPEIEYESALDGEQGRRLNQMVPLPHVPKINGEIPSADEATSDHQRLWNRLQLYELEELKISGDGNCQFRSLSDQIYRSSEHHKFVREQVVNQGPIKNPDQMRAKITTFPEAGAKLNSRPDLYENYVPMAYSDYLKKMSKNGEWGDHVTLQAAADWYGIKIFVITSFKDTCYIEILPQAPMSNRTIFLSFWAEVHYNSIYPVGELPVMEGKKKKSWWRP